MIILGIDPGTTRIGYGLIEKNKGLKTLTYGVIEPSGKDYYKNIIYVSDHIDRIIKKFNPDVVALESLYFSKNKKTALKVSETRGAIILTVTRRNIPIKEFNYNDVKRVVTGYGGGDKESVRKVVAMSLGLKNIEGHDDAADALGVAIRASFEL